MGVLDVGKGWEMWDLEGLVARWVWRWWKEKVARAVAEAIATLSLSLSLPVSLSQFFFALEFGVGSDHGGKRGIHWEDMPSAWKRTGLDKVGRVARERRGIWAGVMSP